MAHRSIIDRSSYNSRFELSKSVGNSSSSWNLFYNLPSRILLGSAVYCTPLGQYKKKHKDSFPQAPGFCADDVFIIAVYFNTDTSPGRKSSISHINDKM